MNSTSRSWYRQIAGEILGVFAGLFRGIWRWFRAFRLKHRRIILTRQLREKAILLGERMYERAIGAESLRDEVEEIEEKLAAAKIDGGPTDDLSLARCDLLVRLAEDVPEPGPTGIEEEIAGVQEAQAVIDTISTELNQTVNVPATSGGELSGYLRGVMDEGAKRAKGWINKGRETYSAALQDAFTSDSTLVIPIDEKLVIGRDRDFCDYVLGNAQVSRLHTQIERSGTDYVVSDLGSSNGTYVNGILIRGEVPLNKGDVLNIGPFHLAFDGEVLTTESASGKAEIICNRLCKDVIDRGTGKKILILNNVSLWIKPCEFTVIIGPSGGGKSTLLNALSGRNPATRGDVLVNGQNLYTHFDALKKNMALVPQKDVLHNSLRLRSALLYTAKLRLPPDLGPDAYGQIVDKYLETVGLTERTGTTIKDLSGGQIKRASLANEIISQPNLLFVDEATSGLDEHTDGEIMQIFREIAEGGKTVVCITHNLTNVEKFCHKVIILAPGGYLVFVGTADEARDYFSIDTLGDVYIRLRDKPSTQWQAEFEETPLYKEMYTDIQKHRRESSNDIQRRRRPSILQKTAIFLRQLSLLSRRGWEIQFSDLRSLFVMGLQCLFVAGLICILFGEIPAGEDGVITSATGPRADFSMRVIFLLTISSFWFGCNNAAKEIIKDKEIYERERDVCLNVVSYYAAKFLMLVVLTMAQVVVLLYVVRFATGLPGSIWAQALSITMIGICGVSTGLFISAISRNTDMAVTLVPVAIIPQVILAGLVYPINGGFAEFLSNIFISCYWGFGHMMSTLPESMARTVGYEDWSYLSSGIVMLHAGIMIAAANGVLYAADKRLSLKGSGIDTWLKNAALSLQGTAGSASKETEVKEDTHYVPTLPDVMVDMPQTIMVDENTTFGSEEDHNLPAGMTELPKTFQAESQPVEEPVEPVMDSDSQTTDLGAVCVLSLQDSRIPLRAGLRLFATDLFGLETREPDGAVAEVVPHPEDPNLIGLRNLSGTSWTATMADGTDNLIEPGKNVRMETGVVIDFGPYKGVIE